MTSSPRRITLCADDYGISPAVNRGIRDLVVRKRLNATSVMMVGPAIGPDEVASLLDSARGMSCQIGLHATLTAPFHPLTTGFRPLPGGLFPPFGTLLRDGFLRRLDPQIFETELAAQIAAFKVAFGRAPDYIDGHQHAQIFPQVRDGFLAAVKAHAPQAWVRQCGRATPLSSRLSAPKPLVLDILSAMFRSRAERIGLTTNPAFDGAYDFTKQTDFGTAMRGFLDGVPDGGLVMCHPGHVDEILVALDPLTDQRQREYDYLAGERFTADLHDRNMALR